MNVILIVNLIDLIAIIIIIFNNYIFNDLNFPCTFHTQNV